MTLCKWAEVEKLQRWGDRMKKLDAVASYLASRPPPGPGAHGKPGSIITKYSQPSLRQSVSTSGYMYTDLNVLVWSVSLFIYICWRACRTSTLEVCFPFGAFNLQCAPDSASSGEMAEEWSVGNPRPVMHKYRMQKQCLFVPFHSDPYILLVVLLPYFLFPTHSSSYHRPLCWQSTNDKRDGPLLGTSSCRVMIPAMQHVQFVVPCPRTSNTPLCYEFQPKHIQFKIMSWGFPRDTSFQTASLASTRWWLLPSASLSTMFQALAHVLREAERLVGSLPSGRPTACAALCCTVCDIGSKMILHKYPIQFWEHYHLSSHAATC